MDQQVDGGRYEVLGTESEENESEKVVSDAVCDEEGFQFLPRKVGSAGLESELRSDGVELELSEADRAELARGAGELVHELEDEKHAAHAEEGEGKWIADPFVEELHSQLKVAQEQLSASFDERKATLEEYGKAMDEVRARMQREIDLVTARAAEEANIAKLEAANSLKEMERQIAIHKSELAEIYEAEKSLRDEFIALKRLHAKGILSQPAL